jgi:hypothetical protein
LKVELFLIIPSLKSLNSKDTYSQLVPGIGNLCNFRHVITQTMKVKRLITFTQKCLFTTCIELSDISLEESQ